MIAMSHSILAVIGLPVVPAVMFGMFKITIHAQMSMAMRKGRWV